MEKEFSEGAFVFPENFGENMSLDETQLSDGELYTILTNKDKKGKNGCLAALIKGTKSKWVVDKICEKVPYEIRKNIKEITVDFAKNMESIAEQISGIHTEITGDRFHAQKLVSGAVQAERVKERWNALENENGQRKQARKEKRKFKAERLPNGDTEKELLARSRYLLFKPKEKWSAQQIVRATILFQRYPKIKEAYELSMEFRDMYEVSRYKNEAEKRLWSWIKRVKQTALPEMKIAANSVSYHHKKILNYFLKRSSNAGAESFNAKLKQFRSQVRGVRDTNFFLFRVLHFFAFKKSPHPIFF